MKTKLFLTTAMLLSCLIAISQSTFSLGPRIGANFASVSNIELAETNTNLVLGLTTTYSINESSGINADLLYSKEGYETASDSEVDIDYLQIPIHYTVFFNQLGESFRPKIYAGFSTGILLGANQENIDIKDELNGLVFGLSGGLGFNYRLSQLTWLNFDLRSLLGLSDIRDSAIQTGDKIAARNLQFSIGVAFGI